MVSAVHRSCTQIHKSLLCNPIRWLCDKIRCLAQKIFGYLLRITVFQLGEFKVPGAYSIMRLYQRATSDPREERPFDPQRLARSKELLIGCGGTESILQPADGKATVRCMTFKSDDFFHHFAELGARKTQILFRDPATGIKQTRLALLPSKSKHIRWWNLFYHQMEKLYLPLIDIETRDGVVKGALLPESPNLAPGLKPPFILHSHSPGRSMCMDRKFIGLHLAAGYDIAVWDPRGTVESTGVPSEGGYYLDAEAVFQHVLGQGYVPNRIYLSGFCEGAAIAAHLKNRYHHLGVHFIAGNPFASMKAVIENHGSFGKFVASHALPALHSADSEITKKVKQDGFDTVKKFTRLPQSGGRFVLIHTDTDQTMPRGSVQTLCEAIGSAGPIHEILRVHPNPKGNGHTQPPYEDPKIWRRYIQVVT